MLRCCYKASSPADEAMTLPFSCRIRRISRIPKGLRCPIANILRVAQGAACLEMDGVVKVITARDGLQVVRRGVRHQYWRADRDAGGEGGGKRLRGVEKEELGKDLIIVESTDPADQGKEVAF
jgi:hypothetical protein